MKKRILASLMSLCLIVGLFPTAALATEDPLTEQGEQPMSCICTALCTEGNADENCLVCVEDYNSCDYKEAPADGEQPVSEPEDEQPGEEDISAPADLVCSELEGCEGDTHAEGCPLYVAPVEPTEEPEEQTVPVEPVAENGINDTALLDEGEMTGACGATESDNVTWALTANSDDPTTYTLTISGNGAMADYKNPTSSTTHNNEKSPWHSALTANKSSLYPITQVSVADGVTYVGNYAFSYLSLSEITFTSSVSGYGTYVFYKCTTAETVDWSNFSNSITTLPEGLLGGCSSLKTFKNGEITSPDYTVLLPEAIDRIGTSSFLSCTSLKSVDLSAIEQLGINAFSGCSSLETVTLPNTVNAPDDYFSTGCFVGVKITQITLPSNTTKIPDHLFRNCTSLTSITIPDTVTEIGAQAFNGCSALKTVSFTEDSQLQTIGKWAFAKTGITEFDMPDSVTELTDEYVFENNSSLTKVHISNNLSSIPKGTFKVDGTTYTSSLTTVEIDPEQSKLTSIGENALYGSKITSITFPSTMTSFGASALYNCLNLHTIDLTRVSSENVTFGNAWCYYNNSSNAAIRSIYLSDSEMLTKLQSSTNGYYSQKTILAITNGGTFAADTSFSSGTLATPTKEGSIFGGWYTNAQFNGEKATAFSAKQTYYAKWIGMDDMELQYGGTQQITVSDNITLSGYTSSDPSVATVDSSGKVTATGVGTATISASGNYNGQSTTFKATVTVIPMPITFGSGSGENPSGTVDHVYDGMAPDYFDYAAFYPATVNGGTVSVVQGSQEITLEPGTDVVFVYDDGSGSSTQEHDALPVDVTGAEGMNVTVKLINPNYRFVTATNTTPSETVSVTVKIHADNMDKVDLYIGGEKVDAITGATVKVYNGEGQAPISDLTSVQAEGIETFTVHFHPLNSDTDFEETHLENQSASALTSEAVLAIAPKEPGQYLMIVNGITEATAETRGKYAYASVVFSIEKATVTIKADDVTVYVGEEMPAFTYTVEGLIKDEDLTGEITLSCTAADTNTAGTYTITPSGGSISDTSHYEIVYEPGTLTVRTRSSGGSNSSGNISGSGDNVSVTASGGSVSASQMEREVEKADRGSTITIKATGYSSVSLPAGGMADAAANNNDVLLDLRYGEVTLSATAIEGLTDGAADSDRIEVSVERQTSSRDEEISELLDGGAVVFDVTVTVDDTEVHSFDGRLTITLTVSNLSSIDDPHVLHLLTDGSKEYYEPDSISGNELTISGIRSLSHFAVIPGSEVPADDPDIALPFLDVPAGSWYEDAVWYVYENGLMAGTSETTFEPDTTTSRGMIVTVLYRLEGAPTVSGSSGFTDVADGQYYADAVAWASSNGIVGGYGNGLFGPNDPITREQMAVILYRCAQYKGYDVTANADLSGYDDVAQVSSYALEALQWANAEGLVNGTSDTTLTPGGSATRSQIAVILMRFCENIAE